MKLNFLAVGDLHYEALEKYLPDGDFLTPINRTLQQIWNYAKDNGIEHIVLLGDIFDNPFPRDESKKAFLKSLDKKLQYHIILGNHDYANINENSLNLCKYFIEDLGLMDNVKFYLEPTVEEINGIKLNFLPYPFKEATCEAPAICFGHFETKGSISDSGRIFKEGVVLDDNYTWILGHLHRQQGNNYPGSICQHRFGEPINKYFFDVKVKDNDEIEINKVSINTPYKLIDLIVNKIKDIKLEKQNIYRIYAADHLDLNEITKACQGYNIWQIKGLVNQKKGDIEISEEDIEYQEQNLADEMTYLQKWLENKDNVDLTEEQIQKAIKIVENLR